MNNKFDLTILEPAVNSDRRNIGQMLEWILSNEEEFRKVESTFSYIIEALNAFLDPNYPIDVEIFKNLAKLRSVLNYRILQGESLPTNLDGEWSPYIQQSLEQINREMVLGERILDGRQTKLKSYLKFHTNCLDNLSLLVGAFIHFYEILIRERFTEVPRDLLCDALCEVICILDNTNLIYDEVANPGKLNWIVNYKGFSERVKYYVSTQYTKEI
jgi:hypothetical protein